MRDMTIGGGGGGGVKKAFSTSLTRVSGPLENFMTAVDGLRSGMLIGRGAWVEYPGVIERPLKPSIPEPTPSRHYVQP